MELSSLLSLIVVAAKFVRRTEIGAPKLAANRYSKYCRKCGQAFVETNLPIMNGFKADLDLQSPSLLDSTCFADWESPLLCHEFHPQPLRSPVNLRLWFMDRFALC